MAKTKKITLDQSQNSLPKSLFELESAIGEFMQYWGFKSMHGRIWTHLFTSEQALDSIELMKRLKVSKGLMSLAIRDLLEYEVILIDHVGRHGATFYKANPEIFKVISNVLKNRETQMLLKARTAAESLHKINRKKLQTCGISDEKIKNVIEMTSSAQILLQAFLHQEGGLNLALTF